MKLQVNCTEEHLKKANAYKSDGLSIALQDIFPACEVGKHDEWDKNALLIGKGKDIVIVRLPKNVQKPIEKPTSFKLEFSDGQVERINAHYGYSVL